MLKLACPDVIGTRCESVAVPPLLPFTKPGGSTVWLKPGGKDGRRLRRKPEDGRLDTGELMAKVTPVRFVEQGFFINLVP